MADKARKSTTETYQVGYGRPPLHTRFKKGQSGNPNGAQRHSPEFKRMRRLVEAELVDLGSLILNGDMTELRQIVNDPNASVLTRMLASVVHKGINKGNMDSLDKLLTRIVGKPKEQVEGGNQTDRFVQSESKIARALLTDPDAFEAFDKLDKLAQKHAALIGRTDTDPE